MEDNKYYESLKESFDKMISFEGLDDLSEEKAMQYVKNVVDLCFQLALLQEIRGFRKDFREANKLI